MHYGSGCGASRPEIRQPATINSGAKQRQYMSQRSNTKRHIRKSSVDSPKEQLRSAWLSFGETLQKIVQLQRSLAVLPMQEQTTEAVLLQKLRIYQEAMPELVGAFERLGTPIMAKQAGGRPTKTKEFSVAWDIAVAYFKKHGKDLSAENLSLMTSKKLMADDPNAYKHCVGWEAEVEDIPRPFPQRTASDCLLCLRVSRPYEE
jgi:hypothetical protein